MGVLCLFLVPVFAVQPAAAEEPDGAALLAAFTAPDARPGLAGSETLALRQDPIPDTRLEAAAPRGMDLSPPVAGLLSAVVPGSAQILQGQNRGFIYLGIEVASWFAFAALRNASNQAEEDYLEFADRHWGWQRYETITDCGPGLGPIDFDEESDLLMDLFQNDRDGFYDEIGDQDVYACGWDEQQNRSSYQGMRDDANSLSNASKWATGVIVVNHLVSAVDAARSASRRRAAEDTQALRWQVRPTPRGDLAWQVNLERSF